jgi:hypothetical protein
MLAKSNFAFFVFVPRDGLGEKTSKKKASCRGLGYEERTRLKKKRND